MLKIIILQMRHMALKEKNFKTVIDQHETAADCKQCIPDDFAFGGEPSVCSKADNNCE